MNTGIAMIIIGVAFSVLVLTLISTYWTVKMTAVSLGLLRDMFQHELKHTLKELITELAELKTDVRALFKHTEDVKRFKTALGEAGNNLHRVIGATTGALTMPALCATGVKVAGKYVLERHQKNTRRNLIMSEEKEIFAGTLLASFVAGAAIGAGLALLYAPKRGTEMRGTIADFAGDSVNKIKEYTSKAQDKIMTAIEDGKETIIEKKTILTAAIEAGRETIREAKNRETSLLIPITNQR